MMQERRQHQRLVPDTPLFVRVEGARGGYLLDMCEGGLALTGSIPKIPHNNGFSLAFDLPDDNGLIQARAEIAWTNDSRDRIGVRFVHLADDSRQQLHNWVSSRAYPTGKDVKLEVRPLLRSEVAATHRLTSAPAVPSEPHSGRKIYRTPGRRPVELALAAVALCSAFVCIGYYLPNIGGNPDAAAKTSLANINTPASVESVASISASTKSVSLPPRLSLDLPGYVVQVAAMTQESNADTLAVTLNRMKFPAFVVRRNGDRFYRVIVGPYGDENSTIQIKTQIENQGFETVLQRWSPE